MFAEIDSKEKLEKTIKESADFDSEEKFEKAIKEIKESSDYTK